MLFRVYMLATVIARETMPPAPVYRYIRARLAGSARPSGGRLAVTIVEKAKQENK